MISSAPSRSDVRFGSILSSPLLILGAVCLVLAVLLTLPLTVPIGPFYWDLYIYFDAANRIFDGQVPGVDFFTPVGPLGYYLFAGLSDIFPNAQPLLLVQWSLFVVTGPIFALILVDIDKRSRTIALTLLVPYLVFQILPFNIKEYYSYPGVDGFGIYNRQMAELLYPLVAALVFVKSRLTQLIAVAVLMLALFLTKITGFAGGVVICLFAFAAGRIALRTALVAAVGFFLALGIIEIATGIVVAYVGDILQLVLINEETLLPRFVQAASLHFSSFGPLAVLIATLAVFSFRDIVSNGARLARSPSFSGFCAFVDGDVFWLAATTFAALLVETQNTGGQGFIFVWPVLLRILIRTGGYSPTRLVVVISMVAAASLPALVDVSSRAVRATVGQLKYVDLDAPDLKTLGAVSQRAEMIDRAQFMLDVYTRFPQTWQYFAKSMRLPSFTLYTEPDFQIAWLLAAEKAVTAIKAYETENNVHFDTIMSLNFVNPFPWLLDRSAPREIAIGADPFRAVPDPDNAVLRSIQSTDLILYPRCPVTDANAKLLELYRPGLIGHRRLSLSPCWDGFIGGDAQP